MVLPKRRSVPMEGLRGKAVPKRPGPTSWRDGESRQGGGWCLWIAGRGRHYPTARARQRGGHGALPRRRSVPMGGLRGSAVPNGPGPLAGGKGSPAKVAVGAHGWPAGDGTTR